MKLIFQNHFFNFYIFLIIIFWNCFCFSSSEIITGKYPLTKRLNNGYYVIASITNITFADSTLTNVIKTKNFDSEIINQDEIGSSTISQFPVSDNGYVLVILYKSIYIFSSDGEFLAQKNTSIIKAKFPSIIIPNGHSNNNYYFTLIYCIGNDDNEESTHINFEKGNFDSSSKEITFPNSYPFQPFSDCRTFYSMISCELMLNNTQEYITCLYGIHDYFYISVFDLNNNFQSISTISNDAGGQYYKSIVLPEGRTKTIACGYNPNSNLNCFYYDITTNTLTFLKSVVDKGCGYQPTSLIMEYFYETEKFIIGCRNEENKIYLSEFSKDLNYIQNFNTENLISESSNVGRVNLILPNGQSKYSIFYHPNINCYSDCSIIYPNMITFGSELIDIKDYPISEITTSTLNCINNNYYNYEKTNCIETIPSGFYCNDTNERTIDKCHDNCETCEKGSISDNNNCLTCKDKTKYLDLGNCVDNCNKGSYKDNSINKCYCSTNDTCMICSIESNQYNLCVTCNPGYYPIKNDPNNADSFINCYNDGTIPNGYFLNINQYEPCHVNCLKCLETGNDTNNNCIECKPGLSLIKNNNNIENCYENCNNYFYFDSENVYHCTDNSECQPGYKLINSTNKCIDDCSNDSIYNYKYEYKNICYPSCPEDTFSNNNYLCELKCEKFNKFYNFEKTKCILNISAGYYCNDSTLNTIDKCHENCYSCNKGPTIDNNNCLTCPDKGTKYFDLGNCRDSCINGEFFDEVEQILKCKCTTDISCNYCNEESKRYNQCIDCNTDKGYYPKSNDINNVDSYINCYKNPEKYYLNAQVYEQCYSTCKFCTELGNYTDNKCIECISTHETKNDFDNDKNCYEKCTYNYYYDSDFVYHCTNEDCPPEYSKLIEPKKRCIDNCKNDNKYYYEYKNKCFEKCPSDTKSSVNNIYKCEEVKKINEEKDKEKCKLEYKQLKSMKNEILLDNINNLVVDYVNQHGNSYDYVWKFENKLYKIYIYKNLTCVKIKANEAPNIDFGECYEKVKRYYSIIDDLIITIIIIKNNKDNNLKSYNTYAFSHPETGKIVNISSICAKDKVVIQEDVMTLIENLDTRKEEFIIYLTKQGIDIFNISDDFYNNLCYHYESPNGRDVPIKDRIASFFPNITLCDIGCENKGVDLVKMKAKCECIFNDLMNNNLMDNVYGQTISEFMSVLHSLNINVMQCIKEMFKKKYFSKNIGGFFILGLLFGQFIGIFKFIYDGLYIMRKYIFSLAESFNLFIKNNPIINYPPKRKTIKSIIKAKSSIKNGNSSPYSSSKIILSHNNSNKNIRNSMILNKEQSSFNIDNKNTLKRKKSKFGIKNLNNNIKENNEYMNKIKEYLSPDFDETDFDEVLDQDKRTFCEYFSEKFKNNQIFINTFFINEILRPKSLKYIILIMTIELYFVINALFYNEEYLSELFNSKEEELFFSFVPRRFNQFIYISAVSGIISYLAGYFFVDEIKLKKIFIRNKTEELKMKYELALLTKNAEQRFIGLILLSIFLSIICFFYISCFNIVYPYIRTEWIKSSLFILIIMQVLSLLITFFETCIRFLGIKMNSKRLFNLSLWVS